MPSNIIHRLVKRLGAAITGTPASSARGASTTSLRRRITLQDEPGAIYAIGDVHGCVDKLRQLEQLAVEDGSKLQGRKLLVMLGDYIDRGPSSAQVIDHLLSPPPSGFERLCLCGNHEAVLLELLEGPGDLHGWLGFGGDQTARSYGLDVGYLSAQAGYGPDQVLEELTQAFPPEHLEFLRSLPVSVSTPRFFFAHAGARPGISLEHQTDHDLLWIRDAFLDHTGSPFEKTVVHGHTPGPSPFISAYRVGVDTGAYAGGPLTAARIVGRDVSVLNTAGVS